MGKFRKDFLWGGATSSSQLEGGYQEGKRGLTIQDVVTSGNNTIPRYFTYQNADGSFDKYPQFHGVLPEGARYVCLEEEHYPSHHAIDFYHNYKEDIKLLAEMGFKVFRMSICWSRIYPKGIEDEPNREGLQFYRNVFEELKKYNIEPLVTLWHGETPIYLENHLQGWVSRNTIDYFEKYVTTVIREYDGLVTYWLTFNEINNVLMFLNIMPEEFAEKEAQNTFTQLHHRLLASAKTVKIAHEINSKNKVGCMIAYSVNYPRICTPEDQLANLEDQQLIDFYCSDTQVRGAYPAFSQRIWDHYNVVIPFEESDQKILSSGTVDFFSFSYYSTSCITVNDAFINDKAKGNFTLGIKNPNLKYSEWGWGMDPLGLRLALNQIYDRYLIPIIIVENGLGAVDHFEEDGTIHDPYRIEYIKAHIEAMKQAIDDGVDLFGYTTWGCIDLVSISTGEMKKRYGFIYVDLNDKGEGTLKRYKKDSFYWYTQVIASNGENL